MTSGNDATPGGWKSVEVEMIPVTRRSQPPALLIASGKFLKEPRQMSPKLPASAITVVMLGLVSVPVALRSKKGAPGSLLVMRMRACWGPAIVGAYRTVKSTSESGLMMSGVEGL